MLRTFLFLMSILPLLCNAAPDTTFTNKYGKRCDRQIATSYNVILIEGGKYFEVERDLQGKIEQKRQVVSGTDRRKNGECILYNVDGKVMIQRGYLLDTIHGVVNEYDTFGNIKLLANYKKGKLNGVLKSYYGNGNLKRDAIYSSDSLVKGKMFDADGGEIEFTPYYVLPKAPYSVNHFLVKKVKYPYKARRKSIEGRVEVCFVVDTTGEIVKAEVVTPAHPLLDAEALRVVGSFPKWEPGKQDDEPVDVYYTLPISFRLEN